jgi:hypothetical protein
MSLTASPRDLHVRLHEAAAVATVARERAFRAMAAAVEVHAHSERLRRQAIGARTRSHVRASRHRVGFDTGCERPSVQGFQIRGVVDGVTAQARWSKFGLECTPALRQRAEIIVALGDTFDLGDGRPVVRASLDGPLTAVLPTVTRAFSTVTSIELAVGWPADPPEAS